jgi:hypothetical protein
MFKLKQSLVAFAGLIALVGLIGLVTPLPSRGQGSSGNAPPPSDVNVVNPATNPALVRDVDRPAAQPYQDTLSVEIPNGETSESGALNPVPTGKRLVVEYASARADFAGDQMATVTLVSGDVRYHLPMIFQGFFGHFGNRARLVASEPVRLYIDAGGSLGVEVSRTGDLESGFISVSISGHLVNVP